MAQRRGVLGAPPRDRPAVAVDRRPAPPRRVHRDRGASRSSGPSTPTTRSRSCSPPRRRAPTAARARSRATSRRPTSPGSPPRTATTTTAASTTRGARRREHGRAALSPASSPRPAFDGPALDPPRRRHPPRLGRPAGGRGRRLDLRLDRAHPHARLRPRAGRRVPPLRGLPHRVRGRRGPPRARGRRWSSPTPRPARSQRVETGEQVFFRRDTWHHAFAHGPEPLRVLELFAPPPAAGASGAYARQQPYLEDGALRRRRARRRVDRRAAPAARRLHVDRPADVLWRRDRDVLCGDPRQHGAPDGRSARASGPARPLAPHTHGGDEVLGRSTAPSGPRLARGRRPRVRAGPRTLLPAGRLPARVPRRSAGWRARSAGRPHYLP